MQGSIGDEIGEERGERCVVCILNELVGGLDEVCDVDTDEREATTGDERADERQRGRDSVLAERGG